MARHQASGHDAGPGIAEDDLGHAVAIEVAARGREDRLVEKGRGTWPLEPLPQPVVAQQQMALPGPGNEEVEISIRVEVAGDDSKRKSAPRSSPRHVQRAKAPRLDSGEGKVRPASAFAHPRHHEVEVAVVVDVGEETVHPDQDLAVFRRRVECREGRRGRIAPDTRRRLHQHPQHSVSQEHHVDVTVVVEIAPERGVGGDGRQRVFKIDRETRIRAL